MIAVTFFFFVLKTNLKSQSKTIQQLSHCRQGSLALVYLFGGDKICTWALPLTLKMLMFIGVALKQSAGQTSK